MESREGATHYVESVWLSFMSDEEVRKQSVVQITNTRLLDIVERPEPGGLYDPLLGPLNDAAFCKTCGQRSRGCPGHCGHIALVLPVYNPLLVKFLHKLLQRTCFFCHHFRVSRSQVKKCIRRLELIIKGDVIGSKELVTDSPIEITYPEESCGSQKSSSTVHSGAECQIDETLENKGWTSLQYTEAMKVLNDFLSQKPTKCKNCEASNPNIKSPTFGWFHTSGLSDTVIRSNVLKGCQLGDSVASESEGVTDVEDTSQPVSRGRLDEREKMAVEFSEQKRQKSSRQLLPSEVKDIMERLWQNEASLCSLISDIEKQSGTKNAWPSMFFLETIVVSPIKSRPPTKGGDSVREHEQTVLLGKVLECNISLGDAHRNKEQTKVTRRWLELQQSVNVLFDGKTAKGPGQKELASGICQHLEKKEGLFRQNMMGKRVNYACRSVISPDPYLDVMEIGIPPTFAVNLTYPERVTPWNISSMRNAVINGPESHPGATHYVDNKTINKLPPSRKKRISISRSLRSSRGAFTDPGKSFGIEGEAKIVNRHLRNGDPVLVNRQPTLHKSSIMAMKVKVLHGERTLRMHYANCSTFNADFDGDEINVHFPQDEISRAEAYNIVCANNQYVRPSNGEPLRSLIQDHIVSAVLLTKKDTLLSLDEFCQLLYFCGVSTSRPAFVDGKPGQKVLVSSPENELLIPHAAIQKPFLRWTGKQVISTIIQHVTRGEPPLTVGKDAKVQSNFFKSNENEPSKKRETDGGRHEVKGPEKEPEDKVLIFQNDLVRGVIDKAQFGEYGLVHKVHELYGAHTAGMLLSVLSRLFTAFLQMHGFTCGVDDLLILRTNDYERKRQLENCERSGETVHRNFIGIQDDKIKLDPNVLLSNIEKTIRSDGESAVAYLDRQMKNELNSKTSSRCINELLSEGLLKPSVKNCIALMTTSGAKGSKVNFQQISSFLGQQELEGKRVPRMVSGKTLPCFHPWEWAARAGGYIIDRFLTGLRPQEYYFHCMAGREGLVDTAVKTSRSGYLQRCLIKNLESLKVSYDHTVRDADGSIVQFRYGEDGVDVHQAGFIAKFEALALNQEMMQRKCDHQLASSNAYISELPIALKDKADKFLDNFSFEGRIPSNLTNREDFYDLVKQKFFLSLAHPGEAVGVLAAQSVGEPSTQMTLNTFHLAGRGEMNVTLGIPRLQEILMTASSEIKTPIMTCPLEEGKTKEDVDRLADKLKKVTVADIVESMKVNIKPFAVHNDEICRIYKLKMKLYKPAHYPQYANISTEDWISTLEVLFVRELEDAIQSHLVLLSKISGIKNFVSDSHKSSTTEEDENVSNDKPTREEHNDDDDEEDNEGADDLGLDSQKRKMQAADEMDYEDDLLHTNMASSEEELKGGELSTDEESSGNEIEDNHPENGPGMMEDTGPCEVPEGQSTPNKKSRTAREDGHSDPQSSGKKLRVKRKKKMRAKLVKKDYDRAILVAAEKKHFEVHFKFTNEPHVLLAEIAQRTAKKVYIQNPGKIDRCQVIDCKENQVIYYGKNPKKRMDLKADVKEKIPALSTAGVDFTTFWEMQDDLDVRYVYSNNINAMLNTYGVEAARETIIREVNHVFKSYGISVNFRHLSLIADFMTHTGGYRPMSRLGGIAESTSPFSKMCFETASKFIVNAALHGEVDSLETPSARICLGLPVKVGTGCFDIMQKLEA